MFGVLPYVFVGGVGSAVGSFVNVLILRFGFSESPQARSHCMACDAQIHSYDLIPILSYLFLRGKCRACGSALTIQYPLVEALMSALFVLSYWEFPPALSLFPILGFLALLVFLAAMLALVVYDARHTLVPMPFIYALIVSSTLASVFQSLSAHSFAPLIDSSLGGGALFIFFMAIYLVTRGKGMGAGDAYAALAIGIMLGLTRGSEAIMLGVWSGTLFYLACLLLSSLLKHVRLFGSYGRVTMKSELPLIPFLAFGFGLALFTALSPLSFTASLIQLL